jgi:shikimate kinase/3-dehydroquinate synthase
MELVLIGPPGSGKSAAGRRIAARHGVAFVDLDDRIEAAAGRPIPAIFETEGEAGFRARERAAILALGEAAPGPKLDRVIAAGGGAILEPRNRWHLFRGRRVVRLQAPPEILLRRLRGGPVRPLLAGPRPLAALRELAERRERFYAAGVPVNGAASEARVVAAIEGVLADDAPPGTTLLRAETPIGLITLGEGDARPALVHALGELGARRAAIVSEPTAWRLHGEQLAAGLGAAGLDTTTILVPRGEGAKTIAAYGRLLRDLARLRLERGDPIVAIGGGALGDAAGFAAATYLRGVPLVHVPTTLVAQIDSAIGGKTAIDIPEGKNLVGAFHQPRAVVVDVAHLVTLPVRQLRAALGEAIKVAALGDERLFTLLEVEVPRIAAGGRAALASGALAELVERCAWRKVEVVSGDERDHGARLTLNLGHSIGHAIEAAAGYRTLLHGEAVAHGLRGAIAIGLQLGITPHERADRIRLLLDAAGLAQDPPGVSEGAVRAHMERDKKHADGRLRWVLPVESGVVIRSDVPEDAVRAGITAALAGSSGASGGGNGRDGRGGVGARATTPVGAL